MKKALLGLSNNVGLNIDKIKVWSKSFKKYLKIGLTPGQYQIPSEVSATAGDNLIGTDISIGTADELVIGSNRTFKFRLKSKNTGKLIDINVTFKKNKVIRA